MGRHDAIDVTSSELRDPTTPRPIVRIEKQRAAATACGPSAGRGATTGTGFFESVRTIGACAPEAARIRSDL